MMMSVILAIYSPTTGMVPR